MTQSEYAAYYIRFLVTTLGPSVKREAHNDEGLQNDLALQADLENKKNGLIVLALVSFIESNFLTKKRFETLAPVSSTNDSHPAFGKHHTPLQLHLFA